LDGRLIDDTHDEFFTVTDGRGGTSKDVCVQCARGHYGADGPHNWTANTELAVGYRVQVAGNACMFDVVIAGTTGDTPPLWPAIPDSLVEDGSVTYRATYAAINVTSLYSALRLKTLSVWGFVNDKDETVNA
jgi:hypothetical protein